MRKVILISGKAESGKTYTANLIKEYSKGKTAIIPLSLGLKFQARELGWDGKKDEKGRTFLQNIGALMKAYHGKDYYAKKTVKKVNHPAP